MCMRGDRLTDPMPVPPPRMWWVLLAVTALAVFAWGACESLLPKSMQ